MDHLAAVAVSNSNSSASILSNVRMDVHLRDNPGVGATSLILDGTPLNHGSLESDLENSVIEFEARLSTLPKIPTSRLGKGTATLTDGDSDPSVFPPAFTVVLGGMPSYLAHRLFTSINSSQVFSQPVNNLPISPSVAAIIAAPVNPETSGCLFYPISETDEHDQHDVQQVSTDSHPVTVVVGDDAGISEIDESTTAVAGLTSEVPAVGIEHAEQYEEEIDEAIQIST